MSGIPVVKITWFDATPNKGISELAQSALIALSQADACLQQALHRCPIREHNYYVLAILSNEEHDAYLLHNGTYHLFQGGVKSTTDAGTVPKVTFVTLVDPITSLELAVKAPVTEVVEIRLKPELSSALAELDALIEELKSALQGAGAHAVFRGRKAGDEAVFVMFIGWDSVQAHRDAVGDGTNPRNIIQRSQQISTIEFIKHSSFSKLK